MGGPLKLGDPMNHDTYPDSYIRGILNTVKSIAMVGASVKENRPSYFAFKYLLEHGYHMIPVNPGHAGRKMLGQRSPRTHPTARRQLVLARPAAARVEPLLAPTGTLRGTPTRASTAP